MRKSKFLLSWSVVQGDQISNKSRAGCSIFQVGLRQAPAQTPAKLLSSARVNKKGKRTGAETKELSTAWWVGVEAEQPSVWDSQVLARSWGLSDRVGSRASGRGSQT